MNYLFQMFGERTEKYSLLLVELIQHKLWQLFLGIFLYSCSRFSKGNKCCSYSSGCGCWKHWNNDLIRWRFNMINFLHNEKYLQMFHIFCIIQFNRSRIAMELLENYNPSLFKSDHSVCPLEEKFKIYLI